MPEQLQLRIHGDASQPTLIYLPGLHGDWTIVGGFRKQVIGKVRFVEFTYPRTLDWSLEDYAAAIEAALVNNGISTGWLLGESYGSQVLWALAGRGKFPAQGLILAGGFVKHPMRWLVRLAEIIFGRISMAVLVWLIFSYGKIARLRYRHSPEVVADIDEFIVRRTDLDRRAAQHRLHLIAANDPRPIARRTSWPVYYLSGGIDPIVPWPFVRRWLRKHCPALRACKIIGTADHNILGTAPAKAASQILAWMQR